MRIAKSFVLLILVLSASGCPVCGPVGPNQPTDPAPTDLRAVALPGAGIRLTWKDNSDNENRFTVEASQDGINGWSVKLHADANAMTADDLWVKVEQTLYYRIEARLPDSDSGWSNIASATSAALLPIDMVPISSSGDSFTMGDDWSGPNTTQSFTCNFSISRYELTNLQYCQFIADGGYDTSSYWTANGWTCRQALAWWPWPPAGGWEESAKSHPTARSWYEAVAFCNWRSSREGLTPVYDGTGHANLAANGYRLPTEVEWEYAAARGGATWPERKFPWGDTWDPANCVHEVGGVDPGIADVGSKSPAGDTPQGVADMSGNVAEWCSDNWQDPVPAGADRYWFVDDAPSNGFLVRGGGSSTYDLAALSCAGRLTIQTDGTLGEAGIRIVRR